jgi:hypothetical protein
VIRIGEIANNIQEMAIYQGKQPQARTTPTIAAVVTTSGDRSVNPKELSEEKA